MQYQTSTQARFWTFTKEQLEATKVKTNNEALSSDKSVPGRLTQSEEEALKLYFVSKIELIVSRLKCTQSVRATAIIYFLRFFLVNSVMDFNLVKLMFTCIYLATKTEEERRSPDQCARESNGEVTEMDIIITEYTLLKGLKFHLEIFHPFLPLTGFVIDMQQTLQQSFPRLHHEAEKRLKDVIKTDAIFLYPPSQIALVALRMAVKDLKMDDETFGKYSAMKLKVLSNWPDIEKNLKNIIPYFRKDICQPPSSVKDTFPKWQALRQFVRDQMLARMPKPLPPVQKIEKEILVKPEPLAPYGAQQQIPEIIKKEPIKSLHTEQVHQQPGHIKREPMNSLHTEQVHQQPVHIKQEPSYYNHTPPENHLPEIQNTNATLIGFAGSRDEDVPMSDANDILVNSVQQSQNYYDYYQTNPADINPSELGQPQVMQIDSANEYQEPPSPPQPVVQRPKPKLIEINIPKYDYDQ